MFRKIDIRQGVSLQEYAAIPEYHLAVSELEAEVKQLYSVLQGRTVWMINSTDKGGGVAEMLPKMIQIFRELEISMEWGIIHTTDQEFFQFTKRMHNMLHGSGKGGIRQKEREAYERVNRENAKSLKAKLGEKDVLIVHDPQPMGLGAFLNQELDISTIWRSHIGTDRKNEATESAWEFLYSYSRNYQHGVFSAPEYVPSYFSDRFSLIQPAIDPLSHKNRPLSPHRIAGVFSNGHLEQSHHSVVPSDYPSFAQRLQADGTFTEACLPESFGFFYRPIVTQISRWDRLKGFRPLVEAFAMIKKSIKEKNISSDSLARKRLTLMRLALVGPDPASIQDDPEGKEVLGEMIAFYKSLDENLQKDIGLFALPMDSLKNNALMVNAIQRCSSIIVQNSIQEGFGLTITEAMWKGIPVLSTNAVGPRQQIRHQIDGFLIQDAENVKELAQALEEMLEDTSQRRLYGENASRHVYQNFLVFAQIRNWLKVFSTTLATS